MRLRQRLITGLVTLLPLIVTLYLLGWVYTYSGAYIQAFLRLFGLEVPRAYQPVLPFVGLFLAGVLVYLVGSLAENYLGKRLIVSLERSLLLLPIVRDIYKAVQQIAHTLFGHQEVKFSRAAVIEYPRRGVYALCFVVQSVGGRLPPLPEGYTAVLVPTSPVPASGMVVLVPSEEVLPLEISVEEALKYVVSAGFLLPEKPQSPLTSLPQRAERPS
ncbi:transporter [Thermus parvatiensis]|uniref:Transporter n=2 Tax=Thermus TaxID=270 RepID=A0A0X8DCD4_9DEIN|nr:MULTISPECIES: DUF502 domain-containing protein [Thermus]AFH38592.1 hypothetical protein TtJL18_0689 [Thermus thermophilus JL-18]AMA75380.1 transporter [Thermus parvatiensis]